MHVPLMRGNLMAAILACAHGCREELRRQAVGGDCRLDSVLVQHIEQSPDAVARAVFPDAEGEKIEFVLLPVLQIDCHRTPSVAWHGFPLVQYWNLNRHHRAVRPGAEPLRAAWNLRAQIPLIGCDDRVWHNVQEFCGELYRRTCESSIANTLGAVWNLTSRTRLCSEECDC